MNRTEYQKSPYENYFNSCFSEEILYVLEASDPFGMPNYKDGVPDYEWDGYS